MSRETTTTTFPTRWMFDARFDLHRRNGDTGEEIVVIAGGRTAAAGVYFVSVNVGGAVETRKVMLIR